VIDANERLARRAPARGGIPERDLDALADYWAVLPSVRATLFETFDPTGARPGYARLRLPLIDVRAAILSHAGFTAFNRTVTTRFDAWRRSGLAHLTTFDEDGHPKALIECIAEDLARSQGRAERASVGGRLVEVLAESPEGIILFVLPEVT
jgi:hypothetical protein